MATFYEYLYRAFLSKIEPERAHRLGLRGLRAAQRRGGLRVLRRFAAQPDPRLRRELFGLTFANPVGLAAGMDKDAEVVAALFALGFGHVEVGTITPRPQAGNAPPRLWRLTTNRALINALGFPSGGAEAVGATLGRVGRSELAANGVLGINLGKNRDTPLERAQDDYTQLVETLHGAADYFAINISSPNTPGLRQLQIGAQLAQLIRAVIAAAEQVARARGGAARPVLLKLAPDLADDDLPTVAETAVGSGVSGLIATNTTISRAGVGPTYQALPGGLSGPPLRERAEQVIRLLYRAVGKRVPIIGVGGVDSAEAALGHIRAGASLVQLYTGFVYGGPATPGRIVSGLSKAADREGWKSIDEIVGIDAG